MHCWGDEKWKGVTPSKPKELHTKVIENDQCSLPPMSTKLCTQIRKQTTCSGDSGGPVVWKDPQTNWYTLVGIHSFGYKYCRGGSPAYHTRVTAYLPWILHHITAPPPCPVTESPAEDFVVYPRPNGSEINENHVLVEQSSFFESAKEEDPTALMVEETPKDGKLMCDDPPLSDTEVHSRNHFPEGAVTQPCDISSNSSEDFEESFSVAAKKYRIDSLDSTYDPEYDPDVDLSDITVESDDNDDKKRLRTIRPKESKNLSTCFKEINFNSGPTVNCSRTSPALSSTWKEQGIISLDDLEAQNDNVNNDDVTVRLKIAVIFRWYLLRCLVVH
ncbi:hypothetical protein GE061_010078 [Apolygus lucorum]|uniref:Peptidase S1 domain-containing protein n=1 Tax=Apolygus lucorum TaxID=248454 RepID=A0A8S9Y4Q6_APOLU|nr:hypothetical protein GE061_010078 [Apolygus lucorum]